MSDQPSYGVIGEFEDPHALVHAARAARESGYQKLDAFTPFPVHGLDRALRIPRSRLGFLVAATGVLGGASALLLQWWTGTFGYPLVIGGKPLFAFEPSVPILFELSVLLAAFGAVVGMILFNGLPRFYHPVFQWDRFRRVSDDRFFLAIENDGPNFDPTQAVEFLRSQGAAAVEVLPE